MKVDLHNPISVNLHYQITTKFQETELIRTGAKPMRVQKVMNVDLQELTVAQREIVVRLLPANRQNVDMPDAITGVECNYSGQPSYKRETIAFDDYLDVTAWIMEAHKILVRNAPQEEKHDRLTREYEEVQRARTERKKELQARYEDLEAEWKDKIRNARDLETIRALVLPPEVWVIEKELENLAFGWQARRNYLSWKLDERRAELVKAERQAQYEAEKNQWIAEYGSESLRNARELGYNCNYSYAMERAKREAEGYVLDYQDVAEWKDVDSPSEETLQMLLDAPEVGDKKEIIWIERGPSDVDHKGYSDDFWDPCEGVIIQGYLGKYNLFIW